MRFDGCGARHLVCTFVSIALASVSTPLLAANRPPTISVNPDTLVHYGEYYVLRPTANDPDGNTLTFSIVNRPPWAYFNRTNGRLYGTPKATDVGRYENIRISVSDGQATAWLATFAINVVVTSPGTITVDWVAATRRVDGSALTNLAGHKIYWGKAANNYTKVVVLRSPGTRTYVIQNVAPGTYYVAISTLDAAGLESVLSPAVRAIVR